MKRYWPEEFSGLLEGAEVVELEIPAACREDGSHGKATHRDALKVRLSQADFQRIWPLAETRYRLEGTFAGKAITLVTNNPHYHRWHPADGGAGEGVAKADGSSATNDVIVHFLLDDVREDAAVA